MAVRRLAGKAPPATLNNDPKGVVYIQASVDDAAPLTVLLDVWAAHMPDLVAYNKFGPGFDMEAGPWIEEVRPAAWTDAPAPNDDTKLGRVRVQFVVPEAWHYKFYAHVSDVDVECNAQVGPIDTDQLVVSKDPEALAKLTPAGRQKEIRKAASLIGRATGRVG